MSCSHMHDLISGDIFLEQRPLVKEPVIMEHLSCRDTFSLILMCPLKTGFTVCPLIAGCPLMGVSLEDSFYFNGHNSLVLSHHVSFYHHFLKSKTNVDVCSTSPGQGYVFSSR